MKINLVGYFTSYAIPQNLQLLVTANQPLCKSLGIVNHDLLN